MKVDTTAIEQEIAAYEKQLRQHYYHKIPAYGGDRQP